MNFSPIQKKKTYERIIDQIQEMIYNKELKRGDKLPAERTLAQDLQVGRSAVREAFSALEMIGLIESRHGEGTFVREEPNDNFLKPLSLVFMLEDNMEEELLEIRQVIEINAVGIATLRANIENLKEIRKHASLIKDNRNDLDLCHRADRNFHYALARATGNRLLYKLLNSISGVMDIHFSNTMDKIVKDDDKFKILIAQHKEIYQAVSNRDRDLAVSVMRKHLNWAEELMNL